MADVYSFVTPTGTIVPDTADLLAAVQAEYLAAFGADLIVTPDTPQGVLIVAEALARAAVADNNAQVANQINPNLAGGIFLDALLALTGSERQSMTFTQVVVAITGTTGTIIPEGTLFKDVNLNQYASASTITLTGMTGTGSVNVISTVGGPITVAAGAINSTVVPNSAISTVTNPLASTPSDTGVAVQSDGAAKVFRRQTLAAQAQSTAEAIVSGLYATNGVTSVSFRENTAGATATIDGVVMVGHSIYACVNGGADTDIANTLISKKSSGSAYNNGASATPVSVSVTLPYSGQVMNILFDRPDVISIGVTVTVVQNNSVQDVVGSVKAAIAAYSAGLVPNEPGLGVGVSVSPFELAGAINILTPGVFVKALTITNITTGGDPVTTTIPITLWQIANILPNNITVTSVSS